MPAPDLPPGSGPTALSGAHPPAPSFGLPNSRALTRWLFVVRVVLSAPLHLPFLGGVARHTGVPPTVVVEAKVLDEITDYSLLGHAVGQRLGAAVPYFKGIRPDCNGLKTMAAAMAAFESFNEYGDRLITESVLNAVIVLMVVTSILGPVLSQRFGLRMTPQENADAPR